MKEIWKEVKMSDCKYAISSLGNVMSLEHNIFKNSENKTEKGIWNIMPVYHGDHMSLQGGMTKINDVKCFYVEHLSMINSLAK